MESARIVIVGGGAVGLSVAYHLAKRGETDVLLLERHTLTSGTTWHAAGIVGPLRATLNLTRLAMYAGELFERLETETGQATGYRQTGGFWLATRPERMDELRRIRAMGEMVGLGAEMVGPETVAQAVPGLRIDDLAGALQVTEDAQVNPVDLCMAYAKAVRAMGVTILENTEVESIDTDSDRVTGVRIADGSHIACEQLALCSGAWTRNLAETVGIAVPLQAVEHMYVVTEPIPDLPDPFPVLRDLDAGIYLKGDAGKLVLGGFEHDAKLWNGSADRPFLELPEDWEQFAPFMEVGLHRCPALENAGIAHFMNGPEAFTVDTKPLIGPTPEVEGVFMAAGMNSVGVMSSAGVGRALAEWMLDGSPAMDLWEVEVARIDPAQAAPAYLAARMREAVADQFALHWPYKQPAHGRDMKRLALHNEWAQQGAVFGASAGWERPLWFGRPAPYSIGQQAWWPYAAREAQAMANSAVLLDLSPFTKIEVTGPDALNFLQRSCAADMDIPLGRTVLAPFLNERGGIEIDATVTRSEDHAFTVTSGAASRRRDFMRLTRAINDDRVSLSWADPVPVIGVMGPGSREVLQAVTSCDLSATAFPFGTTRIIDISGSPALATRISYVGELGWELSLTGPEPDKTLGRIYEAGAKVSLGLRAIDGCRIEKKFGHWGHELGPEVTPLEAEIGFSVAWKKDFIGRDALLRQRDAGLRKLLVLFSVEGEPLLLHDEPIREHGQIVGLTTSGAHGPRTGLDLSLGFVNTAPGETRADTLARSFEIDVAGRCYPATAMARPPYDPDGHRMRG